MQKHNVMYYYIVFSCCLTIKKSKNILKRDFSRSVLSFSHRVNLILQRVDLLSLLFQLVLQIAQLLLFTLSDKVVFRGSFSLDKGVL